jgi:hypothetical protein
MNYQEYDWYFNPATAPKGSASSTDPWVTSSVPGTCIGQACCSEGQTWDSTLNQCVGTCTVTPPATTTTTETFVNNVLTKTSGKYKDDYNLKAPKAYTS